MIALSYLYDHFKEDMKDNEIDLIFYDLAKEGRAIINYVAAKNEDEVSKKFGGGGHAGAAGFVLDVSSDQFKDFLENHKLTSIQ